MSRKSQDKRRVKRTAKAKELRKLKNRSIFQRIGQHDVLECWCTDAEDDRLVSIMAFRRLSGGQTVTGAFLIDFDCLGLKDAFVRVGLSRDEVLDDIAARQRDYGVDMVPVPVEEVQAMVAGAIRWTQQHGFRLPRETERAVKVLGDVGDVAQAGISAFGTDDGTLFYVGRERDLEDRLIGTTLEEFLKRPDVEYDFAFDEYAEEDYTEEELEEDDAQRDLEQLQENMAQRLTAAVRQWCFSAGHPPHPRLDEAVALLLESMMSAAAPEDPDVEPDAEANIQALGEGMRGLLELENPPSQKELLDALEQVRGFMGQFSSPAEMFKVLGLDEDAEDEAEADDVK